jgi:hypothetical protein
MAGPLQSAALDIIGKRVSQPWHLAFRFFPVLITGPVPVIF